MTRLTGNAMLGAACLWLMAGRLPAAQAEVAAYYERAFRDSQAAYERQPANAEMAWKFSRACFDGTQVASNDTQRAELARLGIAAARASIAQRADLAAAHYYLGINLGSLAESTRNLGGLRLVSDMEKAFKKARELDAGFDYAGPDRCLGLLYRDAPGWPVSVGSRSKARHHLELACQLAGDYPENQLNQLETWLKWGEKARASAELGRVERVLVQARKTLTGEAWRLSWSDWDRVWREIKKKSGEATQAARPPKATQRATTTHLRASVHAGFCSRTKPFHPVCFER